MADRNIGVYDITTGCVVVLARTCSHTYSLELLENCSQQMCCRESDDASLALQPQQPITFVSSLRPTHSIRASDSNRLTGMLIQSANSTVGSRAL